MLNKRNTVVINVNFHYSFYVLSFLLCFNQAFSQTVEYYPLQSKIQNDHFPQIKDEMLFGHLNITFWPDSLKPYSADGNSVNVSTNLKELAEGVTYHFRVVAVNSLGKSKNVGR